MVGGQGLPRLGDVVLEALHLFCEGALLRHFCIVCRFQKLKFPCSDDDRKKVCRKPLERLAKSMQQSARKAQGERQGMRFAEGTLAERKM